MKILSLTRYIFTLVIVACAALGSAADEPAMRVPAAHAASGREAHLIANAVQSIRQQSPFAIAAEAKAEKESAASQLIDDMKGFAASFLGTRYRLGASGPSRFDCSGFTSYIYRNFGYELNRDSRSQYTQGQKVERDELRPGDLLFFSSRSSGKGRVGHVAMVTEVNADGSCTFIHASTAKGVTYQKFPDGAYYSNHYLGARRIISD